MGLANRVLVDGVAGVLFGARQDPMSMIGCTVVGGRIAAQNLEGSVALIGRRHNGAAPLRSPNSAAGRLFR